MNALDPLGLRLEQRNPAVEDCDFDRIVSQDQLQVVVLQGIVVALVSVNATDVK